MIRIFLPFLKFVLISGIGILILAIVYLCVKALPFRPSLNFFPSIDFLKAIFSSNKNRSSVMRHRDNIHKKWNKMILVIKSGDERDLRLAIIEADSLIDEILKDHGHLGNDMGERMKSIHSSEFENLDDLWMAHKTRNRLVHESGYKISKEEAKKIIAIYHKCMENLLDTELEKI